MFAQFNTVFESPENGGSPKLFIYSGYAIIQRFVVLWLLLGLNKNHKILIRLPACRAGVDVVGFEKAEGFVNIMFLWLQLL